VAAAAAALSILIAPAMLAVLEGLGLIGSVPPTLLWPLTAGLFYLLVHWLFDRCLWRLSWVARLFGLPDLSGRWACKAQTFDVENKPTYEWSGTVTIHQTWEKIRIYLDTGQSSSSSCVASITPETEKGFKLIYSYRNEPKVGEELQIHLGFAEMLFDRETLRAEGEYYNVKGRSTRGRMTWTKE
jgi:SMODS-associating 2TM, beta-strand rich effector domain